MGEIQAGWVYGAWSWLTRPTYALRDPTERWRAQFFTTVLIVGLVVGIAGSFVAGVSGDPSSSFMRVLYAVALATWVLAYALARTQHYRTAMRLICYGGVAAVLLTIALGGDVWQFAHLGLLVGLAGLMLGRHDAVAVTVASIVGLAGIWHSNGEPSEAARLGFVVLFLAIVLALLAVARAFHLRLDAERKLELAASEARYRGLFEQAFDGVVFVRNGRVTDANRGFSRITGRHAEDLVDHDFEEFIEITGPKQQRASLTSTETAVREGRGKRPDGRPYYVELVSRPQESDGKIAECIAVRDITERKHAELQLSIAHRAVSLGTLAAGVAHEINNPLAWVRTNVEVVGEGLGDVLGAGWRSEHRELSDAINDSIRGVERVELVVRDLGVLSRDDADVGAAVVSEALDLAVRMAGKPLLTRARLVRELQDVPPVRGHPSRLGQVFLNLLTNAAQAFTDDDPERNEVTLRTRVEAGQVVIEVSDNGRGIPSDVLLHVFDPFFTTKTDGTGSGLGLPISRSIVHSVGGTISVRSEVGLGTTFVVELPLSDARAEVAALPSSKASVVAPSDAARVLVVDDEPLVGRSLVRALRGHTVTYCQHGADAVKAMHADDFDLVLCDLMMPEMTGEDIYKAVSPELQARFVFMTGGAFTARARAFLEQVPNTVLPKPFSTADVRGLVSRAGGMSPSGLS